MDFAERDVPGEKLCDAMYGMAGDLRQNVREVSFRVEVVQFCCSNQAVHRSRTFTTGIRSLEEIIFPAERHSTQRTLGGIVIDFQTAIVHVPE